MVLHITAYLSGRVWMLDRGCASSGVNQEGWACCCVGAAVVSASCFGVRCGQGEDTAFRYSSRG